MTGNVSKSRGVRGATGPQGPQGIQGETGPQGAKGDSPAIILRYEQETGNLYYDSDGIMLDKEYIESQNLASKKEISQILDPESTIEKTEVIPVEVGGLHRTTGLLEERDDAIRSIDYLAVTPDKTVFFTSSLPIEDNGTVRVCFYDENYKFVKTVHFELETDFTIESEWRYLRFYRSDTSDATVEMALVTRGPQAEFKKIYFADHGYVMYGAEIDDETMHKLVIEALGKDDNGYNIVEIKAPKHSPNEASLALMNKGDDITQFVDFSSLVYDEDNPTVEIVCQTRHGYKLPEFSVRYNNGKGAGRVKKFAVKPDCIPMVLTSEGIQVRRNNNYDNNATEEELVTVDLANLYDRICELEKRQPRKVIINLKNFCLF